ncbi:ABC transporter permease subunit [Acetatifactor muris]|jgi:putative aldouronate transport system permease protein|uniref:Putative multiple-sugar transport system permease YteP n=1 Tax=Acetatifactor muris TaxID=879566 RepID=A0A2K4ZB83_9FIRM|nr:ABC transporter permease subunit [Acetatifactor muris]MCI8798710.1 sugar ABC transporter permease [Lachnospiraceae bacterium]MCR2046167.1 ABC transporter permease subunit [Acetatifactor muris]SOY27726.1 putative multiple-sugar transport system permease YteP [Acetatifactor muris]
MAKQKQQKNHLGKVNLGKHLKKEWMLYSFLIIPVLYYIIFKYIPMFGNVIAFRKYSGGPNIFGQKWVGFRYFKQFLKDPSFWNAFRNTLTLSITYLIFRFPITLTFALLLNEIRNLKWKKFVQTVSYLPHFISMVIIAGMIKEVVSLTGPINTMIESLGGEKISFIQEASWFPPIYIISGIWQGLGWGTILYLAAMTGINMELYEAAKVDGANRFKQAIHVTIPGIMPTIVTLLILDIGGIMGSNFEKIILLYLPSTYETADVISTLVYRMGISGGNFSYATAVGLFEGVVGLILVVTANLVSRKVTEASLW